MLTAVRRFLTGFAAVLSACSSGPDVVGAYSLQSVGGSALPATVGGGAVVVISGSVDLRSNQTVTIVNVFRPVIAGTAQAEETSTISGTWARDDNFVMVRTATAETRYAIEDDGRMLRSVSSRSLNQASMDVFYEYVLTRP